MKNIFLVFFFSFFYCVSIQAQNITVTEDSDVTDLLQRHESQNRSTYTISGWRIQLLSTTDRRKVESEESKFLRDYPGINIDWEHSKPYYKLRVGAFADKLEASRMLKQLKQKYHGAFLSKANISLIEVINK